PVQPQESDLSIRITVPTSNDAKRPRRDRLGVIVFVRTLAPVTHLLGNQRSSVAEDQRVVVLDTLSRDRWTTRGGEDNARRRCWSFRIWANSAVMRLKADDEDGDDDPLPLERICVRGKRLDWRAQETRTQ
ncbi:unnamed protein product, partial [Tilletia caries]